MDLLSLRGDARGRGLGRRMAMPSASRNSLPSPVSDAGDEEECRGAQGVVRGCPSLWREGTE